MVLACFVGAADLAEAQDVTVPYTFTNGEDANALNANFTAIVDGVNIALANRTTDCAAAGGTWDAGTSTCNGKVVHEIAWGFSVQNTLTVAPGDDINFLFSGTVHNVYQITSASCDASTCTGWSSLAESGPYTYTVPNDQWDDLCFYCNKPGHCPLGAYKCP